VNKRSAGPPFSPNLFPLSANLRTTSRLEFGFWVQIMPPRVFPPLYLSLRRPKLDANPVVFARVCKDILLAALVRVFVLHSICWFEGRPRRRYSLYLTRYCLTRAMFLSPLRFDGWLVGLLLFSFLRCTALREIGTTVALF